MVDFNNETTITTPSADINRVTVLERKYNLLEALEAYHKMRYSGAGSAPLSTVRARLTSLFLELEHTLKRQLPIEEYEALEQGILEGKQDRDIVIQSLRKITECLDSIQLTRLDNKIKIDTTRAILEDKEKGL